MSDGGQGRASLAVKGLKSSQKWSAQRSAVRFIAWLDVRVPPVKDTSDDQTAKRTNDENRGIRLRDNRVGQTQEQTEQQANNPTGPGRKLNARDDKPDREATAKRRQQCRRLVGERHGQHHGHCYRAEDRAANCARGHARHIDVFSCVDGSLRLTRSRRIIRQFRVKSRIIRPNSACLLEDTEVGPERSRPRYFLGSFFALDSPGR